MTVYRCESVVEECAVTEFIGDDVPDDRADRCPHCGFKGRDKHEWRTADGA